MCAFPAFGQALNKSPDELVRESARTHVVYHENKTLPRRFGSRVWYLSSPRLFGGARRFAANRLNTTNNELTCSLIPSLFRYCMVFNNSMPHPSQFGVSWSHRYRKCVERVSFVQEKFEQRPRAFGRIERGGGTRCQAMGVPVSSFAVVAMRLLLR